MKCNHDEKQCRPQITRDSSKHRKHLFFGWWNVYIHHRNIFI